MRAAIIMMLALTIAGCHATRPVAVAVCTPTKDYPPEFLAAAAAELPSAGPHVQVLVQDFGIERDRLRACAAPSKAVVP